MILHGCVAFRSLNSGDNFGAGDRWRQTYLPAIPRLTIDQAVV